MCLCLVLLFKLPSLPLQRGIQLSFPFSHLPSPLLLFLLTIFLQDRGFEEQFLADDEQSVVGYGDGTVTGFLAARFRDFVSGYTNLPAALWHVKYDDTMNLGEEDLEEVCVVNFIPY